MNKKTVLLIKESKKDKRILSIILFGSTARGKKNRDIDICIVLYKKTSNLEMSKIRLKFSLILRENYDIHVFQQLPLYIRKEILKDGKILISKNNKKLYEIAFQTIKEFNLYEKIYKNYLYSIKND